MNNRMLLFDVDGTLLSSNNILSPLTLHFINACKSKGYLIGILTARSRSRKNLYLLEKLPYDFIAFYNGAKIYAKGYLIEKNVLPFKKTFSMLQKLDNDFPGIVIDVHQEPWNFSSTCGEICHMWTNNKKVCTLNKLPRYDIQRIRLESEMLISIPFQNYLDYESKLYYTRYNDAIIVHKKANKGYATKKAAEVFDIPLSQIIAFGDDITDIDMLKIVGTSVAMGNAIPTLKKSSQYVTETNDKDGVALWIKEHLLR